VGGVLPPAPYSLRYGSSNKSLRSWLFMRSVYGTLTLFQKNPRFEICPKIFSVLKTNYNMQVHIDDMIIYRGGDSEFKYGITRAYYNHIKGNPTHSNKDAVLVRWINEEKKYLVVDGYHRIVKGLLEGKDIFRCKIDWFGKKDWWIPPKNKRFTIKTT